MAPITVDPEVLSGAGESISSVGDEIAAAVSTLTASLSGGARSGTDPAGAVFGHSYQQLAQGLLDAGAEAVNAGRSVGFVCRCRRRTIRVPMQRRQSVVLRPHWLRLIRLRSSVRPPRRPHRAVGFRHRCCGR